MSTRTSPWPEGVPCWVDLASPNVADSRAFYAAVLGWAYHDTEAEYGGYATAQVGGAAVAGIGPLQGEGPCAWTLYFAADDADATSAAISDAGGAIVLPPGDVGDLGRLLVAADPTGATFGVWQGRVHIGAELVNEPGGLTWEDLRSPDPDTARAFYTSVFGFRHDALAAAGSDYSTFALPDEAAPLGGMGAMFGTDDVTAHWLVYFAVADADHAVTAATDNGGTVTTPAFDSPFGRMAGLADPNGAVFWVAQNTGQDQPDRSG